MNYEIKLIIGLAVAIIVVISGCVVGHSAQLKWR